MDAHFFSGSVADDGGTVAVARFSLRYISNAKSNDMAWALICEIIKETYLVRKMLSISLVPPLYGDMILMLETSLEY